MWRLVGKGRLPAPHCHSESSLAFPISVTRGWLHALLPCEGDDVFLCLLLCQYGTINFVPSLFQNRFIVWRDIYKYLYICTHIYTFILLYLEIVLRTLSDYFRFQPGHKYHSNIYQTVSGFQVIWRMLRAASDVINLSHPVLQCFCHLCVLQFAQWLKLEMCFVFLFQNDF